MSIINMKHIPKNSFISLVFPHIKTYFNEIALLNEQNITSININNNNYTIENRIKYNLRESCKVESLNTKVITSINSQKILINETMNFKHHYDNNKMDRYLNYYIDIVIPNSTLLYSIRTIGQPLNIDLMNYYTDDIKKIYEQLKNH